MTEVSLTGEQLMELVFIESHKKDHLRVMCNQITCKQVFFEGRDYQLPNNWMQAAAKHAVEAHPEELKEALD